MLRRSGGKFRNIWSGHSLFIWPSSFARILHSARGQTDLEGRFRFEDLKPGPYRVLVSVAAWRGRYEVTAAPGDDVLLQLPGGPAKLRVRVEGPADGPVWYALRTLTGGRVPASGKWAWARLQERAFETQKFTPGSGILVVRAKGHGWNAVLFDVAAERTSVVQVQLPRAGSVTGRVAKIVGSGQNHVRLIREDGIAPTLRGELASLWLKLSGLVGLGEFASGAAADGTFRFDEVPPGLYRAVYGDRSNELAGVDVEVLAEKVAIVVLD